MILRRLILLAVVLSGLIVSAGVMAVGLTYSVYALLEPKLGSAGAVAAIVGILAIVLGGGAAALFALARRNETVAVAAPAPSPVAGVIDLLTETVRERPAVMLLAAVGAGVLAIRNPVYLASALRAFSAPRTAED